MSKLSISTQVSSCSLWSRNIPAMNQGYQVVGTAVLEFPGQHPSHRATQLPSLGQGRGNSRTTEHRAGGGRKEAQEG